MAEKCPTLEGNLASVMQMTSKGFQLTMVAELLGRPGL